MGKRLLVGNYSFDADNDLLIIEDNVPPERLLIVTDLENNKFIYNFADPALGYETYTYTPQADSTIIKLKADCSALGCTSTDRLQIFVEKEHTEVEFSETFIDPVSKIRVSNPENLIDTDFEYGLQSSKWETLQTVNNIPTIYSTSGDIPLEGIVSVTSTKGSKQIRVETTTPHGLQLGDPINVQGLTEFLAEGYFLVTGVATSRIFFYEMDQILNRTEVLNGSYTTIVPSKFFEGSSILLDEQSGLPIVTDQASPSKITVTTEYTHGFEENTKMYLRNTVGPKNLVVSDQADTAPDNRPVVDTDVYLTDSVTVDSTLTTGRAGAQEYATVPYDWESTYHYYFDGTEFSDTADTITWTNHNLFNNCCLLLNLPLYGGTVGNLADGVVYYVKVINSNTIQLCTDYGTLASVVQLPSAATMSAYLNRGYGVLNLVYKVERSTNTTRYTSYYARNLSSTRNTRYNVGRSGTSSYTYSMLIDSVSASPNPTSCVIYRIYYSGDLNSSFEYVYMTYYGQNYNGLGSSSLNYRVGGIGLTRGNHYPNLDITRCLFQSGSNWYVSANYNPTSSVGGTWYVYHYFTVLSAPTNPGNDNSGYDLNSTWGLGGVTPQRIIAFQGRTAGSYTNSADAFSYLTNQRTNGRYTSINPTYNYSPTSASANGYFVLNYNDSGTTAYGDASEIFYAFANVNTAFRNTVYSANHGFEDGITVTVTTNNYNTTTERFKFASGTGAVTSIGNAFDATLSKVSEDMFRLQIQNTPNSDDIVQFPSNFTVAFNEPNPTYNTIYIPNHKIVTSVQADYSSTSGTVIGGLTNSATYLLTRYNDSRFFVTSTSVGEAASAVTGIIGNNTSTATNFDVNIEGPLGISNPTTATITKVEFRGDFNDSDEFVTLTFEDGYSFDVGVNGQRSSSWQEDTKWSPKDISSVIKDIGSGVYGFTVNANPTGNVVDFNNIFNGMTYKWEIRFYVTGQSGTIVLSSAGTGASQFAAQSIVGAYDGIYTVSTIPNGKSMEFTSDFDIPGRVFTFTETSIDANTETVTLVSADSHNIVTGEKLTYTSTGNDMYDSVDVTDIYAIATSSTQIALAASYLDAINGIKVPLTAETGTHTISSTNMVKSILGTGTVTASASNGGLAEIYGNGTAFLTDFKRFDKFWVITDGYMQEFTVSRVLTDEHLTLQRALPVAVTDVNYFLTTQVIPRPDGYSLHKPFDGGIDITAGTSPNCKVTRQTRKYFRYQSGKGIQNSFAINFSPTKVLDTLTANGTTVTATTQELHNLQPGEEIQIYDAEVTSGDDFYNGVQTIVSTPTPYTFTYTASDVLVQTKASGFPSYSRRGWRDSAVRAGMFDDQNGFFYEYDGTTIYAVRRSSTLQLSGYVNTTQGSQIISGVGTSFSSQLNFGDNIVVRGQTYKVVEVSSDNRIVVQPAYRGVSATNVKITKTIDTKVAQADWNIDPCDGTGRHGFVLDINKIQMAYADYSWYGAGKIRFGFKDQNGHVKYVHEFRHNNRLLESYFRSGNLPGRYEIENFTSPNTAPTLFHFGTSVIMDGTFDDDKAYLFSSSSNPFVFTNGASDTFTSSGNTTFEQITLNNSRVYVYAIPVSESVASAQSVGNLIRDPSNTSIPEGTYIAQVIVNGANSKVYASYPGTTSDPDDAQINSGTVFTVGETTAVDLTRPIPLIALRLAPSVDSGVTGAIGERDIVNRMQLAMRRAGITTNRDLEAFIILNGLPSNQSFTKVQSPSLSEIIRFSSGDLIQQGTIVYSTKVSAGSLDIDLSELIDMGNSILGGDSIFPSGPDLVTIAIQPQDTSTISGTTPLFVSGKLTWTESQA